MIMTDAKLLYQYLPLTLFVRVRKGCSRFACERELVTEHNWNILIPKLCPSALCLSRSPGLLNRRPRAPLSWVMASFTASYQHLLWTPTHQGPNGPFGLMWLSLPHLAYSVRTPWNSNSTGTSNSTELYNRSMPTRSLKSNV